MTKHLIGLIVVSTSMAACTPMTGAGPTATAVVNPTNGNTAAGTVRLMQRGDDVIAHVEMTGLAPGSHGMHIHEKGDCSAPDGMSAGGHFNPHAAVHGAPDHTAHHAGDFGNLVADATGTARMEITLPKPLFSLDGNASNSILGKAVIVHADPDDFKTQPAGNSGKRVGCGVIFAS